MFNFLSMLSDFPATGHVFIVSGKSSSGAQKFNVSLACGKSNCDVALMILCNFADGKIVRSSLANGNWTDGESDENLTSGAANPIRRGEKFSIYILVGDSRFHIGINDAPFCTYNFKVPINQIRAVSVSGDVDSISQMDHRLVFPLLYPLVNNDTPDIVYSGFIPRKYEPGHVIVIGGVASGNPQGEFVVMFFENDCSRQLIHFNPRFDQSDVVINTMNGCDDWSDAEVHSGSFPFGLNQPFKLSLAFLERDFKVAVNGQALMSFPLHSIDLEDGESLWAILTGFQIKHSSDLNVQITQVEHIQTGNRGCDGFENYSSSNVY